MFDIFISYRRSDSRADAGRLYDRLSAHFGDDDVFMDIDDIESGQDFVDVLAKTLDRCGAMLVVIGRGWLGQPGADGRRRLDDEHDFVRIEILRAIERGITIVPVLVGGAAMPESKALPDELAALARYQAHEVSDTRFHEDVDKLLAALEASVSHGGGKSARQVKIRSRRAAFVIAAALLGVVLGVTLFLQQREKQRDVRRIIATGDQYVAANDLDAAAETYRKAIALDDDNRLAWRRLVKSVSEQVSRKWITNERPMRSMGSKTRNRTPPAITDAEREAALEPVFTMRASDPALENNVDLLLAEARIVTAGNKKTERAKMLLERARVADPERADVLAELGLHLIMYEDDRSGIDLLEMAVAKEPDSARWAFYLAESLATHYLCPFAGNDTVVDGEQGGCADAIRRYHDAIKRAEGEDIWSRAIRRYSINGALDVFHRYAMKERDILSDNLDMSLQERIDLLAYLIPIETRLSRSGWFDYPRYWLATLYDANGEPEKALPVIQDLLREKGERVAAWLSLYEKVLLQTGIDQDELVRVQALMEQDL